MFNEIKEKKEEIYWSSPEGQRIIEQNMKIERVYGREKTKKKQDEKD